MPVALITGVDGFTGRYLSAELLSAGFSVTGTTYKKSSLTGVSTYACDLLDTVSLHSIVAATQPDVVVHLAAVSTIITNDDTSHDEVNVQGTKNLLAALAQSEHKPRVVILASSANVYGNVDTEVLTESSPTKPTNSYAKSKLAMEIAAREWADSLPIILVRPFNYTGVGQSDQFVLPKIVNHFANRQPSIELGNTQVIRDFSDVRAIVQRYRLLIEAAFRQDLQGEVFNICSGIGHSLHTALELMARISGEQIEVRVAPHLVRRSEVNRLIGSPAKLDLIIGHQPVIPLRDTLAWMYQYAISARYR